MMNEVFQTLFDKYFGQCLDLNKETNMTPDFYPVVILYQNKRLTVKQKKNQIKALFIQELTDLTEQAIKPIKPEKVTTVT